MGASSETKHSQTTSMEHGLKGIAALFPLRVHEYPHIGVLGVSTVQAVDSPEVSSKRLSTHFNYISGFFTAMNPENSHRLHPTKEEAAITTVPNVRIGYKR